MHEAAVFSTPAMAESLQAIGRIGVEKNIHLGENLQLRKPQRQPRLPGKNADRQEQPQPSAGQQAPIQPFIPLPSEPAP